MSSNGSLLAVSTISEIKIFHLRASRHPNKEGLKVHKIEAPTCVTAQGSKLVQFSPDMKWLLAIRNDNSIYVHRVVSVPDSISKPRILDKAIVLPRLRRDHATPKSRTGTYGGYSRSIIRAAWSSDSRILVVGDLSGTLDSWVIEGYEDLMLADDNAVQTPKRNLTSDDDDGDDSDDDSDEESNPVVVFGQHWIRNSHAGGLPRLPSFPLILSFRPARSPLPLAIANGHTTVHPTRHNPHAHSHDLPKGEDRLLAVTSLHQVYEFHVLEGRLSDWSRRNPPSGFPHNFKVVRDRAMDCIWAIGGERERVWLYGSTWLWMFDLSMDLPIEPRPLEEGSQPNGDSELTRTSQKRKRQLRRQEQGELIKHSSGAGSRMPDEDITLGVGSKVRKTIGAEESGGQWISLETREARTGDQDDENYSSDEASKGMSGLTRLRRASASDFRDSNHDGGDDVMAGEASSNGDITVERTRQEGPCYWHTYKYRPILGIVPLGQEDGGVTTNGGNVYASEPVVEVALVERPMWDMDLPPRYHGDQEWER